MRHTVHNICFCSFVDARCCLFRVCVDRRYLFLMSPFVVCRLIVAGSRSLRRLRARATLVLHQRGPRVLPADCHLALHVCSHVRMFVCSCVRCFVPSFLLLVSIAVFVCVLLGCCASCFISPCTSATLALGYAVSLRWDVVLPECVMMFLHNSLNVYDLLALVGAVARRGA